MKLKRTGTTTLGSVIVPEDHLLQLFILWPYVNRKTNTKYFIFNANRGQIVVWTRLSATKKIPIGFSIYLGKRLNLEICKYT